LVESFQKNPGQEPNRICGTKIEWTSPERSRQCQGSWLGFGAHARDPGFLVCCDLHHLGLFGPRNATVITALFVAALSVSGAIFLIFEMYTPFGGLIEISSAPLRAALTHLGQ
jgi:hypothetical protein